MANPSDNPGTLKGFDMLLAISQPAINDQLRFLYDTPKEDSLPIPGTSMIQDYLISHKISMHTPLIDEETNALMLDEQGSVLYDKCGVDGWISCPAVTIQENGVTRVQFSFIFSSEAPEGTGDTLYTYRSIGRYGNTILKTRSLTGWKVSWEADLRVQEIDSMAKYEEEIMAWPKNKVAAVKQNVDSANFQVSAFFCLMEEGKIARTIHFTDNHGNAASGVGFPQFVVALNSWLGAGPPAADSMGPIQAGIPTPHNPFVLGYGIRQIPPPMDGEVLFNPRAFEFTTCFDVESNYNSLNFCMMTTTDTLPADSDKNRGNFDPGPLEYLNINLGEAHGVMGVSNNLLWSQFIRPNFCPGQLTSSVSQGGLALDFRDDVKAVLWNRSGHDDVSSNNFVSRQGSAKVWELFGTAATPANEATAQVWSESCIVKREVSWWSDPIPAGDHENDIQRRIFINVRCEATVHSILRTSPRGSSSWSVASEAEVVARVQARYIISASEKGKWTLTLDSRHSSWPKIDRDKDGKVVGMKFEERSPDNDKTLGIFRWSNSSGYFGCFGGSGEEKMVKRISGWGMQDVGKLEEKLKNVTAALDTQVIMPAGNVFFYKGLVTDEVGNLFSTVFYKSNSTAERM
ncbi:hypothetical protein P154DRAFT_575362 [Amniculicola lignicola CBS 123094]|uniref:Uncharacterized protein n=1 Tax=Amniculicola lignicola CBS 123094 TaxID=1392246 RepID=A0A6A5WUM2_9PLEO|nr:hypothetical protein P154DRAFT_575362 [Amniculicola lignicola CBS 123094]